MTKKRGKSDCTIVPPMQSYFEDATRPFVFKILPEHVTGAVCKDPSHCVIAQAVLDANEMVNRVEVGSCITKITSGNRTLRYRTPSRLRSGLRDFDITGCWNLPIGEYRLTPPDNKNKLFKNKTQEEIQAHKKRFDKLPSTSRGKGMTVFKGKLLPTRTVSRARGKRTVLSD